MSGLAGPLRCRCAALAIYLLVQRTLWAVAAVDAAEIDTGEPRAGQRNRRTAARHSSPDESTGCARESLPRMATPARTGKTHRAASGIRNPQAFIRYGRAGDNATANAC